MIRQMHLSLPTESPDFELNSRKVNVKKMKNSGFEGILNVAGFFFNFNL